MKRKQNTPHFTKQPHHKNILKTIYSCKVAHKVMFYNFSAVEFIRCEAPKCVIVFLCYIMCWCNQTYQTTQKHLFLRFLLVLTERSLSSWSCWIVSSSCKIRTAWRACRMQCTEAVLWSEGPCTCLLETHVQPCWKDKIKILTKHSHLNIHKIKL